MSKFFKIKKYWISTLCLLFFSLTAVAQEYSDETIGFDLVKETTILKKYGVTDQNMTRELNVKRKMFNRRYLAIEKINKTILQDINSTAQKPTKLMAKSMAVTASDIPQTERDVLQAFYNIATNKSNLKGWNFSNPVTSWNSQNQTGWKGVTIVDGHVTELIFEYEIDLNGNIPSSISQFSQLKNLTITGNKNINGSIPPEIVNLRNLETLVLHETKLTGTIPSNIGLMSALKFLTLNINLMTGSIPTSIGQLSELRSIGITNNKISGTIPTEISQLSKLQSIAFYATEINSEIPQGIFQLRNLEFIALSNSTGYIPSSIGQLTKLQYLDFGTSKIRGTLPLELGQLSELTYFSIYSCPELTGTIPPGMFQLQNLTEMFIIGCPNLTGSLPNPINQQSMQGFYLYNNKLTGEVPVFNCPNMGEIFLENNQFSSISPQFGQGTAPLGTINLSYNKLSGSVAPLFQLQSLRELDLSHNELSGLLPANIGNVTVLDLSYNKFIGPIPRFSNIANINTLYLNNNLLSGNISSQVALGFTINLSALHIQSNKLTGEIPAFNCPNVREIFLNDNQFSSISSQFGQNTAPISIIDLSYNKLSGSIAPLFQLQSLRELDLSHNELSGLLPANIGNVTALDLSYNKFIGPIPKFSNIANINTLYLNNNLLNNISSQTASGFTTNLSALHVQSNKFKFPDIMNLMQQHIVPGLLYSPQLKVGEPQTIDSKTDYTVLLSMQYDNPTPDDTFQWYKGISPNGIKIEWPGTTSTRSSLRLSDIGYSDSGYYYCLAKNPILSAGTAGQQLILESEPILLNVLCSPQTTGTLNITSDNFLIGRPVTFSFDTSTPNVYFKWSFYDLNGVVTGSTVLSSSTVSQSYNLPGTYKIKLEAIQNNCTTTIEKTFTVVSCIPITGAIKVIKPTSYPFQFSNPGNSSAVVCNETAFPVKFYASTQTLNIGTQLYLNESLTTVIPNGNSWYQYKENATSYKIDISGKIVETYSCSSPIGYAFRFSSPGRPTSSEVCSQTSFPDTFYAASSSLGIGTQLYLDQNLKTRVGSGNSWRKEGINGLTYRIDNDGKVAETSSCIPVSQSYWYKANDPVVSPQQDYVVYISEDGDERTAYLSREESGNPCQEIIARRIVRTIRVSPCTP